MKFLHHLKFAIPAALSCLIGFSSPSLADAPQSATCPSRGMGHHHMGADHDQPMPHSPIAKQAEEQCSSCHGADGTGINDKIPNLAGQESMYLCGWLAGCRKQGDKCEGHEDLAGKFSDSDIIDFAEFYAHQPAKIW